MRYLEISDERQSLIVDCDVWRLNDVLRAAEVLDEGPFLRVDEEDGGSNWVDNGDASVRRSTHSGGDLHEGDVHGLDEPSSEVESLKFKRHVELMSNQVSKLSNKW